MFIHRCQYDYGYFVDIIFYVLVLCQGIVHPDLILQGNVHQTLSMFPLYVQSPGVCEVILGFLLTAFAGLQHQLVATFTEQTVQTFLDVFTR
jgi:hypothetical protein